MVGKPLIEDMGLSTYNVEVFGKSQNPQGCKITPTEACKARRDYLLQPNSQTQRYPNLHRNIASLQLTISDALADLRAFDPGEHKFPCSSE
jgi:hypothetical protein